MGNSITSERGDGEQKEMPQNDRLQSATYSTGFTLFHSILSQEDKPQNVLISPLSILGALSMCAAGASGDTFREIVESLQLSEISSSEKDIGALLSEFKSISLKIKKEKDVKLHFANAALMLQDITLKDEYRKALEDSFDALLKSSTNPNALVDQVNKWCEEKTEGKIPKIIKSLDGSQKQLC